MKFGNVLITKMFYQSSEKEHVVCFAARVLICAHETVTRDDKGSRAVSLRPSVSGILFPAIKADAGIGHNVCRSAGNNISFPLQACLFYFSILVFLFFIHSVT